MERLKFAIHVLLVVTGFPLLLSANLTRSNYNRHKAVVKTKAINTVEKKATSNSVTDDVSFIMHYPGLVL